MLNKKFIKTTRDGAHALTGYKRRIFIAQVSTDYFNGNARMTERIMGWGRKTVETGLNELRSGLRCFDNYSGRGNKRTEDKLPRLAFAVREIVEPHAQTDPDFSNPYAYLKITAKSVRNELKEKGYAECELPTRKTVGKILNRLGYSLKRVQKKTF